MCIRDRHGSDPLLVVFNLKRAAKKQNSKLHNPFRYERSGSDIVSKLRKKKSKQSTKGSRKSKMQPPWWDSETEKAWTEKRAAVKSWQKGRTWPNPDQILTSALDTQTEQFKQITQMEKLLWRTQCWNNADTVLAVLPTHGREWSYQNNPRLRRHKQGTVSYTHLTLPTRSLV